MFVQIHPNPLACSRCFSLANTLQGVHASFFWDSYIHRMCSFWSGQSAMYWGNRLTLFKTALRKMKLNIISSLLYAREQTFRYATICCILHIHKSRQQTNQNLQRQWDIPIDLLNKCFVSNLMVICDRSYLCSFRCKHISNQSWDNHGKLQQMLITLTTVCRGKFARSKLSRKCNLT